MPRYQSVEWVRFAEQTDDPKLAWLERRLVDAGIPSRRNGYSFHGAILEIPKTYLEAASKILAAVTGLDDDDPRFRIDEESYDPVLRRIADGALANKRKHLGRLALRMGAGPLRDHIFGAIADIDDVLDSDSGSGGKNRIKN